MKNDLTCGIVRDLLPSYVEGLTSEETNQAVEAHLAVCPDCMARKRAMTAPEKAAERAETAKEVDYLKKVERRRWKWAVGAVLCTLALVAAGIAVKLFLIGEPASAAGMAWQIHEARDGTYLQLRIDAVESAMAYRNWKLREEDGVMTITARKSLVSPLGADGSYETKLKTDGLREIWLAERLIWQDGVSISREAWDLYQVKTPYVGDAPALGRIAETLGVRLKLGNYINSLHTSERPYDWTLEFSAPMTDARAGRMNFSMTPQAVIMLALVENLDQVTWTYTDTAGSFHSRTVTAEDAADLLREQISYYASEEEAASCGAVLLDSVKDYAASPADLQRLLTTICYDPINYS